MLLGRAGIMRVGASPAVSVPSSGTIRQTWFPALGTATRSRLALCRQTDAGPLIVAGTARHLHLDLPWPRSWLGEPNTSFKTWLAATPAMTIMEPTERTEESWLFGRCRNSWTWPGPADPARADNRWAEWSSGNRLIRKELPGWPRSPSRAGSSAGLPDRAFRPRCGCSWPIRA